MTRAATGWLGLAWLAFAAPALVRAARRRLARSRLAPALPGRRHGRRPCFRASSRPAVAPSRRAPAPPAIPGVAAPEGGSARRDARSWLAGAGGLAWIALQGLAIGHRGWSAAWLANGSSARRGPARRASAGGAFLLCLACLVLLCHGLAARGFMKGDAFLTSTIGLVVGLVVVFVFWPVARCSRARCATRPARSRRPSSSASWRTGRSGVSTASAARSAAAWPGTRCSSRSSWAPARRSSASPSP